MDIITDNVKLMFGDCLERMKEIPDGSVDVVICDPPYGTSACRWDSVIDTDLMWYQLKRIIKPNGAILMTGCEPFSSLLRTSNLNMYKYDWIWKKDRGSNFLNYKYQPSKNFENIMVFSKASTSFVKSGNNCKYNPQMVSGSPYEQKQGRGGDAVVRQGSRNEKTIITKNKGDRYPNAVLSFKSEKGHHPTQKPVTLMEYLIKTYTSESEVVLDFTMGSGSTGVAAKNLNRKFIGIELEPEYYGIACERIL